MDPVCHTVGFPEELLRHGQLFLPKRPLFRSNYAWKVFNTANQDRPRLELVPEDCTIVKPLFDTFVSRDSVEVGNA